MTPISRQVNVIWDKGCQNPRIVTTGIFKNVADHDSLITRAVNALCLYLIRGMARRRK